MAAPLALAVALLAALTPSGSAQGSCFPYSGVCSSVLGSSFSTFQPSQAAFDIAKNNASFAIDQVNIIKNLNPDCYNLYLNYTCSLYFPPCVNNQPVYQCKALCTATTKSCTQLFTLGGYADKLPKCVTLDYPTPPGISYTDTNCFNPAGSAAAGTGSAPSPTSSPSPSSGTGTSSSVTCPKPLIPNPFNRTDNLPYTCPGGQCCFPCPIYHALLPPSPGAAYYERIVMILELIGTASTFDPSPFTLLTTTPPQAPLSSW
ncbi:hypothetical protein M427DRAFT_427511 [Gonapodya prolifera JEL478]|uniref:FZ domain-containing protein n=1 Tax=Gonapodya prolifera (strain JEL478) TaxID=1344416 RepID=A0A139AT61_GONPJ|nr:hypothetical protein M427DRAFT_427511 [Gonapodya prolifera JEL478]|eukprot:KXS19685.1 hypothetical protein M427DRAFT_427511 [Gonapodya prolifera JEL478]